MQHTISFIFCSNLSVVPMSVFNNSDCDTYWILLRNACMPHRISHLLLGVVYHPPSVSHSPLYEHIIQVLDVTSRQHPCLGIIIAGDFNQYPNSWWSSYPLSQIVKVKTRGESVLDKVFTNIKHWFNLPSLHPAFGNSDHETILVTPLESPPALGSFYKTVRYRAGGQNGRAMLYQAINNLNWTPLLNLTSCEDVVNCFYNTVLPLLDHFMPWVERAQYTTEKPWVSNHFRQLIKWRQQALEQGQLLQYKRLHNKTTSVARSLRKRFYKSQVERLHQSDPRSWCKHTISFLNLNTSSKQLNPANLHIFFKR